MTRNTGAVERGIRHVLFGAILLGAGAVLSACATAPHADPDAYSYEDGEDYEDYEDWDDDDWDDDDWDDDDWEEEDAEAYLKYPG